MSYTLLIGNNFISNNPKAILYKDKVLFTVEQKEDFDLPSISLTLVDKNGEKLVEVKDNVCNYYSPELTNKKSDRNHILITDKQGEIVLESRVLDRKTILVSGIFHIDETKKLTITQNYIILPSEKWIMHDKVNANYNNITISDEGIKVLSL